MLLCYNSYEQSVYICVCVYVYVCIRVYTQMYVRCMPLYDHDKPETFTLLTSRSALEYDSNT